MYVWWWWEERYDSQPKKKRQELDENRIQRNDLYSTVQHRRKTSCLCQMCRVAWAPMNFPVITCQFRLPSQGEGNLLHHCCHCMGTTSSQKTTTCYLRCYPPCASVTFERDQDPCRLDCVLSSCSEMTENSCCLCHDAAWQASAVHGRGCAQVYGSDDGLVC